MDNFKTMALLCSVVLTIISTTINVASAKQDPPVIDVGLAATYLSAAQKFFNSGMAAHKQAQTYSGLMPNEDPQATRMLRESINKATGSSHYA